MFTTNVPQLRRRLAELAARYDVPGASVSVLADGEVTDAAAGVVNVRTGVEAQPDSPFMIQSITKVWTATLVTQLVDEGLVALKHFVDEHVARASQHLAPGRLYSYCSAGMGMLGRLVEVVRGTTYTDALRQHPTGPLHLDGVVADAGEALAFRTAIGHVRPGPGEPLRPLRTWAGLPPSNPAAGNQLAMPARGLIEFARMHLADGLGPGGARGRRSDPAYGGSVTPDGPHGPR